MQMTGKQKIEYLFMYYWHYMLGICMAAVLIGLLIHHLALNREKPEFTCVMVNQEIDDARDKELRTRFSTLSGVKEKQIVFDSNYVFSYGAVQLEGVNESSFEKFFFQWSMGELDAVVMPESCYDYCREVGGVFISSAELGWEKSECMKDGDTLVGIYASDTILSQYTREDGLDRLVVVFPIEGKHKTMSREFVRFLQGW